MAREKGKGSAGCLIGILAAIVVFLAVVAVIVWSISIYTISTNEEVIQHGIYADDEQGASGYGLHDSEELQESYQELAQGGDSMVEYEGEGIWGKELELENKRELYSPTEGDASDTWTIMVYLIGSDLESTDGAGSDDLEEMMKAELGEQINLLVQTGGASMWFNDEVDSDTRQRFEISDGAMIEVADIGQGSMSSAEALGDFLNWGTSTYQADHYGVILWDHGGGTQMGYGYDEVFDQMMSLDDVQSAFESCEQKFAFVGFDACLMQTVGTAYMLEPFADYLFASEDELPSEGWYYTPWLESLAANPGMSTLELGARVTDATNDINGAEYTFSILDLREIQNVYQELLTFYSMAGDTLANMQSGTYRTLSTARAGAKSYGGIDQIDAIDMLRRCEEIGYAEPVIEAMQSCIKYRNNSSIKGNFGLSMFYPTKQALDGYSQTRELLLSVDYQDDYVVFLDNYVTILSGGNVTTDTPGTGLTGYTEEANDYSGEDWYEDWILEEYEYADPFAESGVLDEDGLLMLTDPETEDGDYMVEMTDAMWELITDVQMQCLMTNDGLGGYVDLGSDQYWTEDEEGNLLVTSDDSWVNVNGYTVAYYATNTAVAEDGSCTYYGKIPAMLNGDTRIDIYVAYQEEYEVLGYLETYGPTNQVAKGYKQLKVGDTLDYVFTFYGMDGTMTEDVTMYEESDVVTEEGLSVYYDVADAGDNALTVCYMLTDIYDNQYYTQAVEVSFFE